MSAKTKIISDTNVWIDLEAVPCFISKMFQLPYQFIVTDMLYRGELKGFPINLTKKGLVIISLNEESMIYLQQLNKHQELSFVDCSLLALVRQERCPLLTGDQCLRNVARGSDIEVMTTLWILGELVRNKIISLEEKDNAHKEMIINGRLSPRMKARKLSRSSARKAKL